MSDTEEVPVAVEVEEKLVIDTEEPVEEKEQPAVTLKERYLELCRFGDHKNIGNMDGAKFAKMCRDCKLLDKKKFISTDVDLIFVKRKKKGQRVIQFDAFLQCLEDIAKKKYPDDSEGIKKVKNAIKNSPIRASGTIADNVRLHDDRSTYTGVYAKGGPSTADEAHTPLNKLLNRKPADVRGVNSPVSRSPK